MTQYYPPYTVSVTIPLSKSHVNFLIFLLQQPNRQVESGDDGRQERET